MTIEQSFLPKIVIRFFEDAPQQATGNALAYAVQATTPHRSRPLLIMRRTLHLPCFFWLFLFTSLSAGYAQSWPLPSETRRPIVITIDPGHGGHDSGAVGPTGIHEKDVALEMAQQLKKALGESFSIRFTRDGDYSLDIEKRSASSNFFNSDVFVSLHAGSGFDNALRGVTVFCHTNRMLYQPEKTVATQASKHSAWYQIQESHTSVSKKFANLVHERLLTQGSFVNRAIQEAPLKVLEGIDAAAILIEIGYLSHPAEGNKLIDETSLSAIAQCIAEGIRAYCTETDSCNSEQGVIEESL